MSGSGDEEFNAQGGAAGEKAGVAGKTGAKGTVGAGGGARPRAPAVRPAMPRRAANATRTPDPLNGLLSKPETPVAPRPEFFPI